MIYNEKTIDEINVFQGKIIDVLVQNVQLPNERTGKREIVKHPGGVAILAFKDKDTLLIVEQFRKPFETSILEIPAGKLEKDEDPEKCGIRELEEETGYKAKKFEFLGMILTSPGFCNEKIYIYKAEELFKGRDGLCDEDEFINVHEISVEKIKKMIKNGKINDAKTICAFMYL